MTIKKTHPQLSQIRLVFEKIGPRTDIRDMFMTPPLRVMRPFFDGDFTDVMIMSSSPGLLEGDRQVQDFHAREDAKARILSQSYEKVHPVSPGGLAQRLTKIQVDRGASLICRFLPIIFYKDSRLDNKVEIRLEDESSQLIYIESFAAGRVGHGESFEFRDFSNTIKAWMGDELIYFENSHVDPGKIPYDQVGYFEGYDHYSSIVLFNFDKDLEVRDKIYHILKAQEERIDIHSGISTSYRGDIQIRILANMGQDILETLDLIIECAEDYII